MFIKLRAGLRKLDLCINTGIYAREIMTRDKRALAFNCHCLLPRGQFFKS